jgi:hypothetical protein
MNSRQMFATLLCAFAPLGENTHKLSNNEEHRHSQRREGAKIAKKECSMKQSSL